MDVKLYQINLDRDEEGRAFMSQDWLARHVDDPVKIDSSIYDCVFAGEIDGSTLEDAFAIFNFDHPDGYKGRSMSVSDVLVTELEDGKLAAYFCDSIGFTHVDFDMDAAKALSQDITVVILEPGKMARVGTIDGSLAGMQKFVGGYIEAFYPFEEPVCIVCNEEGKLLGLEANRRLGRDIIAGVFYVVGEDKRGNFTSLTQAQMEHYTKRFWPPELFLLGEITDLIYAYIHMR